LRFGEFVEVLDPGYHWKVSFADEIHAHTVLWTTYSTPAQSLTTKDGKDVVIKMIIKYRVVDIKTFLLEVWDAIDAISDMTQGIGFDIVKGKTWEELQNEDLKKEISKKARVEAKRWGIEIETVTLSDLAKISSIRLLNDVGALG
jgi:regulator of protease activity HflC (stomatin/prohibitin superfamily)